ncbi:hypothetical protein N7501_010591, partial [Penicillium viridicatum]
AARVYIRKSTSSTISSTKLENKVAIIQFIKEHSELLVPRVFAYKVNENNPVYIAFILIELLSGSVAIDALGSYDVYRSIIPKEYRQTFYYSIAKTIVQNRDSRYKCSPLPGIGSLFNIATEFFEAVKFKWDKETIINAIIENFPSQIKGIASRLSVYNKGLFPLAYNDFLYSNIIEGAFTVPYELIAFPDFLIAIPTSFDLPKKYDRDG